MEFSEHGVYVIGAIMALLLSMPLLMAFCRYTLAHTIRNEAMDRISRKAYFAFLLIFPVFLGFSLFYHYYDVTWLVFVGMILDGIALYSYLRYLNHRKFNRNNDDSHDRIKLPYIAMTAACLIPVIAIGTIALTGWLMPDIVEITREGRRFEAKEYYVIPYTRDTRPGRSYIYNTTADTIYRVNIRYAYLGEELHNLYTVESKYAPGEFARMRSRANYAMKIIPPVMMPSSNRRGRYHTQRVFLTNGSHLRDFHNLDMTEFGLKGNLQVDYITPDKDRVIRESPDLYNAYKFINPDPYHYSR